MTEDPKTILITDADDGVGLAAAKVLYDETPHKIVLACKTLESANAIKAEVEGSCDDSDPANLIPMQCDLSSFKSITAFSVKLQFTLSKGLDVVCLNAGFAAEKSKDPQFTESGQEVTLGHNFFGPFLLLHRIIDMVKEGGRVVVTASELHNKVKGSSPPSFQNFGGIKDDQGKFNKSFIMVDGSEYDRTRAFVMSKLCNVTFTVALDYRLEKQGKGIVANCFDPGATVIDKKSLMKKVSGKKSDSFSWGGGALAFMATDDSTGTLGGQYWKGPDSGKKGSMYEIDFKPHEANPEASDELNQKTLWKIASRICGVDGDEI